MSKDTLVASFQRLLSMMSSLKYDPTFIPEYQHYSVLPPELQQIYDTLHQQTTVIYNTVTKYTLLQQINSTNTKNCNNRCQMDTDAVTAIGNDLFAACQILVACIMTLHTNQGLGCAPATCRHAKRAVHQILHAVVALIQAFFPNPDTPPLDPAQRTGVVWDACHNIIGPLSTHSSSSNSQQNETLNSKSNTPQKLIPTIPLGNRNAIRRDLLQFKLECQDTIREFELLWSQSRDRRTTLSQQQQQQQPSSSSHSNGKYDDNDDDDEDDVEEEDFEDDEFYTTARELKIVTPCLALLKCSRGALNITVNMIDHIGMSIVQHNLDENDVRQKYRWIQSLTELIHDVGMGVTELGATMYPPLTEEPETSLLAEQVMEQSNRIQVVLEYMCDEILWPSSSSSTLTPKSSSPTLDLELTHSALTIPVATVELLRSVMKACDERTMEAMAALDDDH
jgi:Grap2 and cyclin-D-interacting